MRLPASIAERWVLGETMSRLKLAKEAHSVYLVNLYVFCNVLSQWMLLSVSALLAVGRGRPILLLEY